MGSLIERKKRILMATDPELPPWYQRVEYIRAKSYAYIITQYNPSRYDEIEIEYMSDSVTGYQCLFSAGTAGSSQLIALGENEGGQTTQGYYYAYFNNNSPRFRPGVETNKWYKMTISRDGVMTVNDKSTTSPYVSDLDGVTNLYVFRRTNTNSSYVGKLKSFKITNNGTVKLNLVPCVRLSDGIAGVYDSVSNAFYSSVSQLEQFTPSTLDT